MDHLTTRHQPVKLLHALPLDTASVQPERIALIKGAQETTYGELAEDVLRVAAGLVGLDIERRDRVAVYLPKQLETVEAFFGVSAAGAVFVPVNPVLKPFQVGHILRDSGTRILITSAARAAALETELAACPALQHVILVDEGVQETGPSVHSVLPWSSLLAASPAVGHRAIDADMVAILYTSGSTGKPKGVVLSHRNMVAGAASVCEYLENRPTDRLLAALPFSFDYGFSQLSTAFLAGASVVLMDYLMPRDIVRAVERHGVTGLAAVPPLWIQLAELDWPTAVTQGLRYITNSGGAMPQSVLRKLRERLPKTSVFLMYGLTEAFRSTYLPPDQVAVRPTSMGKAIPNAEVLVVRPDGAECAADEPGELVHRGALVSLGYWNDPARTAERFRPLGHGPAELPIPELAVWSGDTVTRDEEGYLYFVGRRDEMIKTSGYRVSPSEIEEAVYSAGLVAEAAALGVPHAKLGKAIVVVAVPLQEAGSGSLLIEGQTRENGETRVENGVRFSSEASDTADTAADTGSGSVPEAPSGSGQKRSQYPRTETSSGTGSGQKRDHVQLGETETWKTQSGAGLEAEPRLVQTEKLTARLLEACRAMLPAYMIPLHVEWRESLPRNANGKLDRPALAAACIERYGDNTDE